MLSSYFTAMAAWSYIIIVLYHWLRTGLLMVFSSVHTAQYITTTVSTVRISSSDHRTYDVSLNCRRDPRALYVRPHFLPDQHHVHQTKSKGSYSLWLKQIKNAFVSRLHYQWCCLFKTFTRERLRRFRKNLESYFVCSRNRLFPVSQNMTPDVNLACRTQSGRIVAHYQRLTRNLIWDFRAKAGHPAY